MARRKTDVTSIDPLKEILLRRYRVTLVNKLTPQDLEELKCYLEKEFDEQRNIVPEFRLKLEEKLRIYIPEEVMKKEMINIETLLSYLTVDDLKRI